MENVSAIILTQWNGNDLILLKCADELIQIKRDRLTLEDSIERNYV